MLNDETLKSIEAKRQEIIKTASFELLNTLGSLSDTFNTKLSDFKESEVEIFDLISQSIISFSESNPQFTSAIARPPREKDKVKHLPGQHKGISIKFDLHTGETLFINFYGGLRAFSGEDLKDQDSALRHHHSKRTDDILSQPTHINWHISKPDQRRLCEVWTSYLTESKFTLSHVFWEEEEIDLCCSIDNKTYGFGEIASGLQDSISALTTLIPSA